MAKAWPLALMLAALLAGGPAAAAERLLSVWLVDDAPGGSQLVRTGDGLGLLGPRGLLRLQPGASLGRGPFHSGAVSRPAGRWRVNALDTRNGGYFDGQSRGRLEVLATDPAAEPRGKGAWPVALAGWPLAVADVPDGGFAALIWLKGAPMVGKRRHRMLLWSPAEGVVRSNK